MAVVLVIVLPRLITSRSVTHPKLGAPGLLAIVGFDITLCVLEFFAGLRETVGGRFPFGKSSPPPDSYADVALFSNSGDAWRFDSLAGYSLCDRPSRGRRLRYLELRSSNLRFGPPFAVLLYNAVSRASAPGVSETCVFRAYAVSTAARGLASGLSVR